MMGKQSTKNIVPLLLALWILPRMSPFCAAVVEIPLSVSKRPFLRLYIGASSLDDVALGEEKEGMSNVTLVQFHALSQVRLFAGSDVTNVDSVNAFCNIVVSAIFDIVQIPAERRFEEEDEVNEALRTISDWDSFENVRSNCRQDLVLRASDSYFSFVYTKISTTSGTYSWIRPPTPYNVSKRYCKSYGVNPDTGRAEELRSNDDSGRDETDSKDERLDNDRWSVRLDTKLAPSGGMHRDLHHSLLFYTERKHPFPENETYHGTVDFFLHLPADLFINIEDCFRWINLPQNSFQIENISTVSSALIDQEEPAFVSPVHLLRIRIQFSVLFSTVLSTRSITKGRDAHQGSLEFTTQIHARYPKPLSPSELANFQLVLIPPPILISGNISNQSLDLDGMSWQEEENLEWLQWWVAPGQQRHFPLVMTVTIVVAVLGAIWMWRDLSQISAWD